MRATRRHGLDNHIVLIEGGDFTENAGAAAPKEAVVERLDGGRTEPTSSVLAPRLILRGTTSAATAASATGERHMPMSDSIQPRAK